MNEAIVTAAIYCTCGTGWKGTMPASAWSDVIDRWGEVHKGEGHEPCDRRLPRRGHVGRHEHCRLVAGGNRFTLHAGSDSPNPPVCGDSPAGYLR